MTNTADPASLPPSLLTRSQQAQVETAEANARKAAADADTSALQLAQTKYKSLVPDLTGVATNAIDDKSSGVAFSGLVTYSALNRAARKVASRIFDVLSKLDDGDSRAILVTSQDDLLTNDLLRLTVQEGLDDLIAFAGKVLELQSPAAPETPGVRDDHPDSYPEVELPLTAAAVPPLHDATVGLLAGAAGATAFGPLGLAAAAVGSIPSIISLFSSTTTVKGQTENITDLATTTAVVSAVSTKLPRYVTLHEDFRFAPAATTIGGKYRKLAELRVDLLFKQEAVQAAKNTADLALARAQRQQDAAKNASPAKPGSDGEPAQPKQDDHGLAALAAGEAIDEATAASANATAVLALITSAISGIDGFVGAVNATAAGTRSPLAIASLSELLRCDGEDHISYVLSVKGLGGESAEYTKDRRVGRDTYTTLADASIAFMLYRTAEKKIISAGVATGMSSVHGDVGQEPKPPAED